MRRTDQEFKAEVMRRSAAYRAKQRQMTKKVLTTALCLVLVIFGIQVVMPMLAMGGATETAVSDSVSFGSAFNSAAEPAEGIYEEWFTADDYRMDLEKAQSEAGLLYGNEEQKPEEPDEYVGETTDVVMDMVISCATPDGTTFEWKIKEPGQIEKILDAIALFYELDTDQEILKSIGDPEGTVYEITFRENGESRSYTLCNDALHADHESRWVGVSAEAFDALVQLITQ